MMRTKVDPIEDAAFLGEQRFEPAKNVSQTRLTSPFPWRPAAGW